MPVSYTIPNQPTLPAEGVYGQLELLFIAESPPGLWPENQNSNAGLLRKTVLLPGEDVLGLMADLFSEMFADTAVGYLGMHEEEVGLPKDNENLTIPQRRARVLSRKKKTMFTRTRRREIVEEFIYATFGYSPAYFGSEGLSLDPYITFLGDVVDDISTLYTITEDIEDFSYVVWVDPGTDIDQPGLQRELEWFTPAHISFTIDRS